MMSATITLELIRRCRQVSWPCILGSARPDRDRIFPEWKLNASFITMHLKRALDIDDNLSSHPVEVECPDANMVNQIFDGLSYSKAGSSALLSPSCAFGAVG